MNFRNTYELPARMQRYMPKSAQQTYVKTFNRALDVYGEEEQAYATAWGVVKQDYERDETGRWVKRS